VLELRADDGRGPFSIQFREGMVVDAQAHVPLGETLPIALSLNLVTEDDVPRVRGALMFARTPDEIETIANSVGLSSDETLQFRRRAVAQRAAMTFTVAYGGYSSSEGGPTGPHADLDIGPIIYLGALTYMPAQRLRDELGRLGDSFELVDATGAMTRFGFTDADSYVLESLRTPRTQETLVVANRHMGPREVLAVLYALVTTGVVRGSRRAPLAASGPRSAVPGTGVTFKPRTTATTPPQSSPSIRPSAPMLGTTTPPPAQQEPDNDTLVDAVSPLAPIVPRPARAAEDGFDLNAALLDELGDAPLPFEGTATPTSPAAVNAAASDSGARHRTIRRTGQLLAFIGGDTGPGGKSE
jgi:hypothetical protein